MFSVLLSPVRGIASIDGGVYDTGGIGMDGGVYDIGGAEYTGTYDVRGDWGGRFSGVYGIVGPWYGIGVGGGRVGGVYCCIVSSFKM